VSPRSLRVLVVDDSAVVRQTLRSLLSQGAEFDVAVAADPLIAMRKIEERRPHVIVLDLEMPRMNGLTFLRQIMAEDPIPVVVCSAFAAGTGRAAIDALEAGAVDVITKPAVGVRGFLEEQALVIGETLRGAARARLRARGTPISRERVDAWPGRLGERWRGMARPPVVAIGASTGGTQALRAILGAMPAEGPAFVIVQHMPAGFTRAFAERLDQECALGVHEAVPGDRIRAGCALVAPGDRHMELCEDGQGYRVEVTEGPLVSRHRPSVDVLFRSVARTARGRAVGALLTGMGEDGADGLLAMKHAGAATLAQDESTSVVFGMPRAAVRRGAAAEVLPLPEISDAILDLVSGLSGSRVDGQMAL
jgi:two-component system chemotaxis response regulator CheB